MTMPVQPAQDSAPAPAPAAPAAPAPAPAAPAETAPANAPKWDGDFDPARAAQLVANLREEIKGLKDKYGDAQAKLTEYQQSNMSDAEKIAARVQAAESELATLRREKAVSDALRTHSLSDAAAKLLTGTSPEEINEQAAALAALIPAKQAEGLPPTLPVPGNGSDPSAVSQLTREQFDALSPAERMAAYRAGRIAGLGAAPKH